MKRLLIWSTCENGWWYWLQNSFVVVERWICFSSSLGFLYTVLHLSSNLKLRTWRNTHSFPFKVSFDFTMQLLETLFFPLDLLHFDIVYFYGFFVLTCSPVLTFAIVIFLPLSDLFEQDKCYNIIICPGTDLVEESRMAYNLENTWDKRHNNWNWHSSTVNK